MSCINDKVVLLDVCVSKLFGDLDFNFGFCRASIDCRGVEGFGCNLACPSVVYT